MKENIRADINFERINLLYRSAPIAVNGLLIGFLSLFIAVKDLLPSHYLILWSSSFLLVLMWRLFLIFSFNRQIANKKINTQNIQKWEYFWVAMTAFTAFIFASLIFFPFTSDSLIILLFISTIFMGFSSGSAISSNSSKSVVLTFLTLTSLPLVCKLLYDGQPYYFLIAFIYTFFYLVLIRLTLHGNQIVVENITLKQQSERDSLTDLLTGLWNRRRLKLFIEKLIPHSQRNEKPFSIILLDIDHFKNYNDTYGHVKGDEALVLMANCLKNVAREGDLVVRFGGEEFLIVLPDANVAMAQRVVERVMETVRTDMQTTVSAGIAMFTQESSFEQLVKHADVALYTAKNSGRDQFTIYPAD